MEEFKDTLGAGSYPEPLEPKEKNIYGEVSLTFNVNATVPTNWDEEEIEEHIKEELGNYIDLNNYRCIDVELQYIGEEL